MIAGRHWEASTQAPLRMTTEPPANYILCVVTSTIIASERVWGCIIQLKSSALGQNCLLDDARVHVIRQLLVDLCHFCIHSLVEGMTTVLEPFVEIETWNMRQSWLDHSTDLCHHAKSRIIDVQPKRISHILVNKRMIP